MRILYVEPDEYYHHYFQNFFGDRVSLRFAPDAAAAGAMLREERPDVMMMELLLPDLSGYEFLKDIFPKWQEHPFPIIIYSQIEHPQDVAASLGIGIAGYFIKGKDHPRELEKSIFSLNFSRA